LILGLAVGSGCEKEKTEPSTQTPGALKGVFVVNEGAFQAVNSSITFISDDGATRIPDIYSNANGFPAGDVLQSMTIHHGKAYLCVNNSQRVEVVSMENFKRTGFISGILSPRYFCGADSLTGFISDWASNRVYKVNLNTLAITDSIQAGTSPEEILIKNNRIFICNSGAFGDDSTVTIADLNSGTVIATPVVGVNPTCILTDVNNDIWILCRGSLGSDYTPTPDDPGGRIVCMDPNSFAIKTSVNFSYDEHPLQLKRNGAGDMLYFLNGSGFYTGAIYRMSILDSLPPSSPLVSRDFYSLGIHPKSGIIHAGKSSFSSNTHALRFGVDGTVKDSVAVGIGPNGFVFN